MANKEKQNLRYAKTFQKLNKKRNKLIFLFMMDTTLVIVYAI